ncbi:acyl-CoA thioesterase [Mycobacterium sp. JS623]|uniref:acyl-CoA thioesterase n=1 Tax=Mycobacterium sp. JS623 TaxID=212767 RepID=UPI0002A576B1|nr:acyl-CoA thioesterase domain-containing protein [Mycobacterium sp. JS623]AGB24779.1 acyl-CoA thioesterase [Mycobacterium sp. JS623]
MPDLWSDLLACLDLRSVPSEDTAEDGVAEFEGRNQRLEYHRVFGGQLLGQFIQIASAICPDKSVKSQHAVFAREGRADEPIHYLATRQHEGRSFATVTITARQSRGVIATSSVCLHVIEDGPQRQSVDEVPALLGPEHQFALDLIPWETRAAVDLTATTTGPPEFQVWMRTPAADPRLAPALAAYGTDLTLIGTALRPMDGVSHRGNGTWFTSAVTSHTIWFHRPFRTDSWFLLRQHSPLLAHGRSFGRGDILTEDGSLVASYAQEALLRFPN